MFIRLGVVLVLFIVVFWLWVIFDALTADAAQVRLLPKWAWIIVALFPVTGTLAWMIFGRPRENWPPRGPELARRQASGPPVGPDDDPDFLRGL